MPAILFNELLNSVPSGQVCTLSPNCLFLNILGDTSSRAQEQYESMDVDEGGNLGPARCEFLALLIIN